MRKEEMIAMREQGRTYEEIAKHFGVSRQRVFQIVGGTNPYHFVGVTDEQCVYPAIRKWMNDNKISRNEVTRMIYGNILPNNYRRTMCRLAGRTEIGKDFIDKILKITGFTYEEAFVRGKEQTMKLYEQLYDENGKYILDESYTEILNLDKMLTDANIPHTLVRFLDGWQVIYSVNGKRIADAIQHRGSYGNTYNLLEIMGLLTAEEEQCDSVKGWLTAEDVFNRMSKHYNSLN